MSSERQTYIDLTDNDFVMGIQTKLRVELAESLQETKRLKSLVRDLECENSDLKSELKKTKAKLQVTEAVLGETIVAGRLKESSLKRVRSPSLEMIEAPPSSREKGKSKAGPEIPPTPSTPPIIRKQNRMVPYVSVPARKPPLKVEHASPKRPLNANANRDRASGDDINREAKRPKIEHAMNEQKTTGSRNSATTVTGSIVVSKRKEPTTAVTIQSTAKTPSLLSSAAAPARNATASSSKIEPKPKPTIKTRNVFSLPSSITELYMQSAQTLQITPPPIDLAVPRAFLRVAYAGSDQQFIQQFPADKNPSGPVIRRLVFPMLDMNPLMPSEPGEPGMVFASRHEILYDPPWTLFCKLPNAARALWKYLGEYENELCGVMNAEQFRSQKLVVKQEWAKLLMKTKLFDCYVSMRSRIALRKAGLIPLEDKEEEKKVVQKEMRAVKSDKGHPVNQDDIIQAFSRGDEAIDIIRMTCVHYDHVFANDMKAKFPEYPRLLAASKAKSKGAKSKKSHPRRARQHDDDSDKDIDSSSSNDHDDDGDNDHDDDDDDAGSAVPATSSRAAAKATKRTKNQSSVGELMDRVNSSSVDVVDDDDFQIVDSANEENEGGTRGDAPSSSEPRRPRLRRSNRRKSAAASLAQSSAGALDDDAMDLDVQY